ncbi:hypothetical protein [Paenibacillus sp. FSL K6-2524]
MVAGVFLTVESGNEVFYTAKEVHMFLVLVLGSIRTRITVTEA